MKIFCSLKYIINSVNFECMFRAYGVPVFLRNRNKLRLLQSMEPVSDAVSRKLQEKEKVKKVY